MIAGQALRRPAHRRRSRYWTYVRYVPGAVKVHGVDLWQGRQDITLPAVLIRTVNPPALSEVFLLNFAFPETILSCHSLPLIHKQPSSQCLRWQRSEEMIGKKNEFSKKMEEKKYWINRKLSLSWFIIKQNSKIHANQCMRGVLDPLFHVHPSMYILFTYRFTFWNKKKKIHLFTWFIFKGSVD